MLTLERTRIGLTFVIVASLITACIPTERPILEQVAEILEGDVFDFHIVEIDMEKIVEGLDAGSITLPLVDPENRVIDLELAALPIQLRAKKLIEGGLRNDKGDIERVALPREQNFRIGECAKSLEKFNGCGSLTILDEARTMIGGILVHEKLGLTFFEPVDGILGGTDNPGLHLIYNVTGTETIDLGKGEEPEIRGILPSKSSGLASRQRQALVFKETSIVLDGDVQFYQINTNTVWARQEEVFNAVSLVYGIIEPLSVESPNTATWGLDLEIKGQDSLLLK